MTGIRLHLLFGHLPATLSAAAALVLLAALVRGSERLTRVGLAGLGVAALAMAGVHLSGGAAERVSRELPGVSHELIAAHAAVAFVATVGMAAAGGMAAGLLVLYRGQMPRWAAGVGLGLALLAAGLAGWTGWLGIQVSHPAARPGTVVPTIQEPELARGGWVGRDRSIQPCHRMEQRDRAHCSQVIPTAGTHPTPELRRTQTEWTGSDIASPALKIPPDPRSYLA